MSEFYKTSGVNLDAGYESVNRIKKHLARTKIKGAMDSLGAFGGMFDLSAHNIQQPVLVSGTDGVGTKLMIAFMANKHDTIGIDAVAMCVNDVLVQGAMPLFFLDYIAVGKNNPIIIEEIVKGVADGCELAECALIGGETAEMPDMYAVNHYDIAGFCVGAVEKSKLINGSKIKQGNQIIGIASSGVHSNGFSFVRKILFKDNNFSINDFVPQLNQTLSENLLTPTKIYVKTIKHLLNNNFNINGMSHITGGGFYENLPRMFSDKSLAIEIKKNSFPILPIFSFLQNLANISEKEMFNVFNMGIGFALVVEQQDVEKTINELKKNGEQAFLIGEIVNAKNQEAVCFV